MKRKTLRKRAESTFPARKAHSDVLRFLLVSMWLSGYRAAQRDQRVNHEP